LLALLGAHLILHVSKIRVNYLGCELNLDAETDFDKKKQIPKILGL
jgi:hypothetical protein